MGALLDIAIATARETSSKPPLVAAGERRPATSAKGGLRDLASRHAIIAARDAAQLEEWRAPLILGHLVVCGNCDAFKFGSDPAGLGHCARFGIEAAPFCPFQCPGFQIAEEPAALPFIRDPAGVQAWAREFK